VSALERLDRYQRRHRWLGLPLGVVYKFFDDRCTYLAATMTYYGFVALFPLLLLFFSAAGFFLDRDLGLRHELERNAVSSLPVIGGELRSNIGSLHGSTLGLIVGVLGTLYGGTGMMQAAQVGFNRIYGVPRNEQPNPVKSRLRSLALLGLLGGAVLLSSAIPIALSTANGLSRELGPTIHVIGFLLSFVLALVLFTAAFTLLTTRQLGFRQVLRGGVLVAACYELLQVGAAALVTHEIKHAHALYGTFAIVLGAIVWIYIQAIALMVAAEINVVLQYRLWPRALLTPFTDEVELTAADRRAYSLYAATERFKGFERVETHFEGFEPLGAPGDGQRERPAGSPERPASAPAERAGEGSPAEIQ
jgi:YihY family inner membrane protein